MSPSKAISSPTLAMKSAKSAKDCVQNSDTDVVHYETKQCNPKFVGSAIIARAGVTNSDQFQRFLHDVNLSSESDLDLIVIRAVIIQKDRFSIPNSYKLYCILMTTSRKP